MTQESLFAPEPPAPKMRVADWQLPAGYGYRTHRNDPPTSREAEKRMVKSGKITEQQKTALEFWIKFGPGTSRQIKERAGKGEDFYYLLSRRKGELKDAKYLKSTGKKFDNCQEFEWTGKKWCQN